jgi:transposase
VANLKRLLAKLRRAYPAGQRLILIWDNWPVHANPAVLEAASALGVEILWLPTYAPWTNPIEKLWRWLAEDLLRHHAKADRWRELQQEAFAWLDRFAGPSPDLLRYVGLAGGQGD